jgi:hypothetical protein
MDEPEPELPREEPPTDARPSCKCRACGADYPNPYSEGESFLCDACLTKPTDPASIDRVRRAM